MGIIIPTSHFLYEETERGNNNNGEGDSGGRRGAMPCPSRIQNREAREFSLMVSTFYSL